VVSVVVGHDRVSDGVENQTRWVGEQDSIGKDKPPEPLRFRWWMIDHRLRVGRVITSSDGMILTWDRSL
jgi:hypothetical protein